MTVWWELERKLVISSDEIQATYGMQMDIMWFVSEDNRWIGQMIFWGKKNLECNEWRRRNRSKTEGNRKRVEIKRWEGKKAHTPKTKSK